jgi:5-oxoprolinase (ATP-hydrolysing) subunit A
VRIELNCDAGEGRGGLGGGHDDALIPLVSAVNVACGAHAGDAATIRRTVALARDAGAVVGAHPSYPDLAGFGRRHVQMTPAALEESLVEQVEAVGAVARELGSVLRHVKIHGALYNEAAIDVALAEVVVRAIARCEGSIIVVGPPGSRLLEVAGSSGLPTMAEGFADRAYEPDGSLRSRTLPGAVHTDPDVAARQAVELAAAGQVATICIHGDTPGAPAIAAAVRAALAAAGHDVPGGRPGRDE